MRKPLTERVFVLYEDRDLIVIEKASGILTYPVDRKDRESAIQLIRRYWEVRGADRSARLYLIHRLDKDTSGLLVFAKTTIARRALLRQFETHVALREYLAITTGIPKRRKGKVDTFVGKNTRGKRAVTRKGRKAMTVYEVIRQKGDRALVRCRLHTGRTHQVRIHLAFLGIPVCGDRIYGKSSANRMALHASTLGFYHPRDQRPLVFFSSLPQELLRFL